jgi:hypothetical protein
LMPAFAFDESLHHFPLQARVATLTHERSLGGLKGEGFHTASPKNCR